MRFRSLRAAATSAVNLAAALALVAAIVFISSPAPPAQAGDLNPLKPPPESARPGLGRVALRPRPWGPRG